ncbi:MAG TPA: M56 family metallopeptidase, partial [Acidobacteriaceae bacterium]|nr:M56 family metallopeptidase [Acidobacteriaceae bacterium]
MNAAAAFGVGLSAIGALPGWIAQAATAGLIAAVWQGIVLSAAVALVLRLLPKTPAPVRFAIWFGLFLVVAALPSFALFGSRAAGSGRSAWLILDERDCFIVAAVWAIASLVRAVTLVLAVFRVRSLWKQARPLKSISGSLTPVAQPRGFAMVCEQAGSRQAELCVSSHVDRPTVIGFFSPKILIPAWLVEKLSP